MYRYKQKKGKKKERSQNFSLFSCPRNARTFKLLSLRVRCIRSSPFYQLAFFICSLNLSEIIAINSLLVGLPLSL